jgi:hypothetical protein
VDSKETSPSSSPLGACTQCGFGEIVCRNCGELQDIADLVTTVKEQKAIIEEQKEQFEALAKLLANTKRSRDKLLGQQDRDMRKDELWPVVLRVLKKWAGLCYPEARELQGGERARNVFARLKAGFTEEELVRCAYGYSHLPFLVNGRRMAIGSPAQRRVDAEIIYADPKRVADGLAMAAEADRRQQVLAPVEQTGSRNGRLTELGAAAVEFAKRFGWHVFPVQPRGKKPVTPHGLLDATVDVARITAFWQSHPQHNVAIRCGVTSGIVVLDVDGDEGLQSLRALERKYGKLPKTLSVVTPRGGQHFYFAHPGDGGYVLGRPSVGANNRIYQVDEETEVVNIPMWLLTLLIDHENQQSLFSSDHETLVHQGVKEGKRNDQLTSLAGSLLAHGYSADYARDFTLGMNQARCSPPLSNREVVKLCESVAKRERRKSQQTLREIVGTYKL